jgi:hypothetical protein
MPEARWNTHIACLARLCDAAGRGLDLIDVAGLTGLAFRTSLARQVSPAGQYLGWAWEPSFRQWLDILGLDADVAAHRAGRPTYDSWLQRQHGRIADTLARGFPVLWWDNVGFALILGEEDGGYLVSGLPSQVVHPFWLTAPETAGLAARLRDPRSREPESPCRVERAELTSVVEREALFVYVHGVGSFDPQQAYLSSLALICAELAGRIAYPRLRGDRGRECEPQFGTEALTRWREDLKGGRVHPFGMIQALQALGEARRLGAEYLSRLADRADPDREPALAKAAHFFTQIGDYLRPSLRHFDMPLNAEQQMTRGHWEASREALYQVQQTEGTAARLLASLTPSQAAGDQAADG